MLSEGGNKPSSYPKIRSSRVAKDFFVSARRDEEAVVYPLRRSRNTAGRKNLYNPKGDTTNFVRHGVTPPRSASSTPASSFLVPPKIGQYRDRTYFRIGAIDRKKIIVGGSICVAIALCAAFFSYLLGPVAAESRDQQILMEVKSGDGYKKIISDLGSKGLIRSRAAFTVLSLVTGSAMNLKPGLYRLNSGMTSGEILSELVAGSRKEISVTVVEGYSVYDINRLLTASGVLRAGELVEANKKKLFEGKLFPDTYRFFTNSGADEVVEKFLETFRSKTNPIFAGMSTSSAASNLILASLVEKEVPDFEDRKIIAGILKKRLEAGIPLQVDATICYAKEARSYPSAQGCYPLSPLDFKIDSPYNTYSHMGFPPGPIGNPGLSALVAVLHPKSSPYWYYLSDPATRKTIFSRDLDEQEGNRVKYLGSKKK